MGILTLAGVGVGSHPASLHLPPALGLGRCYFCLVIVQGLCWLLSRRLSARSILPPVGSSPGCLPLPPMPTHTFSWGGRWRVNCRLSVSRVRMLPLCGSRVEAGAPLGAGGFRPSTCTGGGQADHTALHAPASGGQAWILNRCWFRVISVPVQGTHRGPHGTPTPCSLESSISP